MSSVTLGAQSLRLREGVGRKDVGIMGTEWPD